MAYGGYDPDRQQGAYGGGSGPSGPRAGFWIRFGAALVDGIILGIVEAILRAAAGGAGQALDFLVGGLYLVFFFGGPRGQTIGFRVCGIRVISMEDGGPIGYGRAAIRWIVGIVSAVVILIGYFWMLWDRERQTWHDKASTSVVVPVSYYPINPRPTGSF